MFTCIDISWNVQVLGVTLYLPSQRNPWYCAWQWHLKPLSVSTQSPPCWQGLGLQWSSSGGWKVRTINMSYLDLAGLASWFYLEYRRHTIVYLLTVTVCSFVPWRTDTLKATVMLNTFCAILTHIWLTAVTHWNIITFRFNDSYDLFLSMHSLCRIRRWKFNFTGLVFATKLMTPALSAVIYLNLFMLPYGGGMVYATYIPCTFVFLFEPPDRQIRYIYWEQGITWTRFSTVAYLTQALVATLCFKARTAVCTCVRLAWTSLCCWNTYILNHLREYSKSGTYCNIMISYWRVKYKGCGKSLLKQSNSRRDCHQLEKGMAEEPEEPGKCRWE